MHLDRPNNFEFKKKINKKSVSFYIAFIKLFEEGLCFTFARCKTLRNAINVYKDQNKRCIPVKLIKFAERDALQTGTHQIRRET